MRVWIGSLKRWRQWLTAAGCVFVGGVLLSFPQAAQNGIHHGLAVCGQLLIPSLFPFLVLSGFIIRSGIVHGIGRRIEPLTNRLFGCSGGAATAMILSVLGGYPAGANAVATLIEQGEIDRHEGQRLLRCCVNAGPAFIIGGVGVGMLGCAKAGALLLGAHLLSSLVVALIERKEPSDRKCVRMASDSVGKALVDSVHNATASLISMCGFVLLASCMLALLDASGISARIHPLWRCLIACITEVSTGCTEAAQTGAAAPFWIGAALGFGGLSVHGQIASRMHGYGSLDVGFFRARLLHALLGGCLSFMMFRWWHPQPHAVSAATAALSAFTQQGGAVGMSGLLALVLMCVLFLFTLPKNRLDRTPY